MVRQVSFVGGVSGSGKTTFCKRAAAGWSHLVAGELIAREMDGSPREKVYLRPKAGDSGESDRFQRILLRRLAAESASNVVLDGHYVVPTATGPAKVPGWFFEELKPVSLYLVEVEPLVAKARIEERQAGGGPLGSLAEIDVFAAEERAWAEEIAARLRLTLHFVDGQNLPSRWRPALGGHRGG